MTAPRAPAEILAERLRVVLDLTELNAAMTTATAQVGGAEIEMRSLEDRPDGDVEAHAAEARSEAAREMLDDTARRIEDLTARLETLDRELHDADNRGRDKP